MNTQDLKGHQMDDTTADDLERRVERLEADIHAGSALVVFVAIFVGVNTAVLAVAAFFFDVDLATVIAVAWANLAGLLAVTYLHRSSRRE